MISPQRSRRSRSFNIMNGIFRIEEMGFPRWTVQLRGRRGPSEFQTTNAADDADVRLGSGPACSKHRFRRSPRERLYNGASIRDRHYSGSSKRALSPAHSTETSRACEESRWNFFVSPLSSVARSRCRVGAAILLSAKHSVYAGWEEQPQPAPPGCGLSTSFTSLKPRSTRA